MFFRSIQIELTWRSYPQAREIGFESPIRATCSTCGTRDVHPHPLKQKGHSQKIGKKRGIPKRLADYFTYKTSPEQRKFHVKWAEYARIVT